MKSRILIFIGIVFQITIYSQVNKKLEIDELIKGKNTFEIEFLKKYCFEIGIQLRDSLMLSKEFESELEQRKKYDTTICYNYKVEILPLKKTGYRIRLYGFDLKCKLSSIDTLNNLYKRYFNDVNFIYEVDSDLKVSKVLDLERIEKIAKYYLQKEEEIKKYSFKFSNNNYTWYKSFQIPTTYNEVDNYLNLHILMFVQYQQDLTQKYIYPQEMGLPRISKPVIDTLHISQMTLNDTVIIENHINITENEIAEIIAQEKVHNSEQMMKPFNYYSIKKLFLTKNNREIRKYLIETEFKGDDFFMNTILNFRIINGG